MPPLRSLTSDALRNFKFHVSLAPPAGSSVPASIGRIGFMTADGFATQTEVIPYREGGDNAQPMTAQVLTPNGFRKMADIHVGDEVIDPHGERSVVTGVFPKGVRPVYRVTTRDGAQTEACYQHLWEVKAGSAQKQRVIDTLELKDRVQRGQLVRLPALSPVEYADSGPLPIAPYLMGVLIADGGFQGTIKFTKAWRDEEMIHRVEALLPEGLSLNHMGPDKGEHYITAGPKARSNAVASAIRDLGLAYHRSHDKFIPEVYLHASVEDRLELLRGLMDGDGSVDTRGRMCIGFSSSVLTNDVKYLINSLGGRSSVVEHLTDVWYTSPTQPTPKAARDSYKLGAIHIPVNPFHLARKAERYKGPREQDGQRGTFRDGAYFRTVASVEYLGEEEVQCIRVSAASHLYITDDFMVTHNTTSRKLPGQTDYGPITMSRGSMAAPPVGAAGTGTGRNEIYLWTGLIFSALAGSGTGTTSGDFRSNITVDVLEHPVTIGAGAAGSATAPPIKLRFLVYNAWVMALSYSGLDAGGNGVLIESCQIAHEGFIPIYASIDAAGPNGPYLSNSVYSQPA